MTTTNTTQEELLPCILTNANGVRIVEGKKHGKHCYAENATCECGEDLIVSPPIYFPDHKKGDPVMVCCDHGVHGYRFSELRQGQQPKECGNESTPPAEQPAVAQELPELPAEDGEIEIIVAGFLCNVGAYRASTVEAYGQQCATQATAALHAELATLREQAERDAAAMAKFRADVDRCYRMLLSEPDTKGALFKAENILRGALADAAVTKQKEQV